MRWLALILALTLVPPLHAAELEVAPGPGALALAIAGASPGDVLILRDGTYAGPVTVDRPLTISGPDGAVVDGVGQGSVVTIAAADVTLHGFTVTGSGRGAGLKLIVGDLDLLAGAAALLAPRRSALTSAGAVT